MNRIESRGFGFGQGRREFGKGDHPRVDEIQECPDFPTLENHS
jgi:hypothetical protein